MVSRANIRMVKANKTTSKNAANITETIYKTLYFRSLITTIKRLLLSMLLRCSYQISVILRNTHLFPYHHPNAVQMPLTMTV
ncbi:hypothetical protein F02E060_1266 [Escherichia coli]|nr:hypothetical protein F02E060_1266 [Escherichia coli]